MKLPGRRVVYTLDSFLKFIELLPSFFDHLLDWFKTCGSLDRLHSLARVTEVGDVVALERDHQLVGDHAVGAEQGGAGEAVCHSGRGRLASCAVRDADVRRLLISWWRHDHGTGLVVVVILHGYGGGHRCNVLRFSGLEEDSPTEDRMSHSWRSESLEDDLVELVIDMLEWEWDLLLPILAWLLSLATS